MIVHQFDAYADGYMIDGDELRACVFAIILSIAASWRLMCMRGHFFIHFSAVFFFQFERPIGWWSTFTMLKSTVIPIIYLLFFPLHCGDDERI